MPELTEEDIKNMSPEQISELQKQNCVFCHIISGKIPSYKVYEDEHCIAILDINPASKGHMLLIPKEHYLILPQVPENTLKHLAKVAKLLSLTAIKGLGAEGTNIFIANGAVAGQRAPHFIIHIIPRKENDSINCFELPEREIRKEDIDNIQKALANRFGVKVEEKELEEIDLKQLKTMLE